MRKKRTLKPTLSVSLIASLLMSFAFRSISVKSKGNMFSPKSLRTNWVTIISSLNPVPKMTTRPMAWLFYPVFPSTIRALFVTMTMASTEYAMWTSKSRTPWCASIISTCDPLPCRTKTRNLFKICPTRLKQIIGQLAG
ncbi:hypothetical protein D3C80_1262750 [compost metagenome]